MATLSWFQVATVAWNAGFRGGDLVTAVAITQPESGRRTDSRYVTSQEDSRGLWQINTYAHPNFDRNALYDAQYNANAAHQVYRNANFHFSPWTTYVDGKYRPFMATAQSAVNALQSGGRDPGEGVGPFPGPGEGNQELQAPELAASYMWVAEMQYAYDRTWEAAAHLHNFAASIDGLNRQ